MEPYEAYRIAVVEAVTMLALTFRQEASKPLIKIYEVGLGGLTAEQVRQATNRAVRECEFMPPPAGLRKLAGILSIADRSMLAWEAFRDARRKHGYYQSVDFDDPVINATIRNLGGWCEVIIRIDSEDETDKWVRRDFERIYQSLCRVGVGPKAAGYLLGRCECDNRVNGYAGHIPLPTKVLTGLPAHPAGVVRIEGPRAGKAPLALTNGIGKKPE